MTEHSLPERLWTIAGMPVAAGASQPEPVEADLFENAAASSTNDGYSKWKAEADAERRAFELRWGIPLGKRVRLQLRGEAREREGVLRLAEEAPQPGRRDARQLRLSLDGQIFPASLIESISRL